MLKFTVFGAKLRASVDNPRMARSVGVNVPKIFAVTFAAGCGFAALGGVVGTPLLPLEPYYALRLLVPVLMVVAVGGLGSPIGSLGAALLLGVVDTFGRYYIPTGGAFVIYFTVVIALLLRPKAYSRGLEMSKDVSPPQPEFAANFSRHRLSWLDFAPFVLIAGLYFVAGSYVPLITQIMIMSMFALSLDLALGYGGVETLGQAALFGAGAYGAGIFALRASSNPISASLSRVLRRNRCGNHRADRAAGSRHYARNDDARGRDDAA